MLTYLNVLRPKTLFRAFTCSLQTKTKTCTNPQTQNLKYNVSPDDYSGQARNETTMEDTCCRVPNPKCGSHQFTPVLKISKCSVIKKTDIITRWWGRQHRLTTVVWVSHQDSCRYSQDTQLLFAVFWKVISLIFSPAHVFEGTWSIVSLLLHDGVMGKLLTDARLYLHTLSGPQAWE